MTVGDIILHFGKGLVELLNTGGLVDAGEVLEVLIWQWIFFVIPDCHYSVSDAG